MKKSRSTIRIDGRAALPAVCAVALLLILWQGLCMTGLVPAYMLPSPLDVVRALVRERALLWAWRWAWRSAWASPR